MISIRFKNIGLFMLLGVIAASKSSAVTQLHYFSDHPTAPYSSFYVDLNSNSRNVSTWVQPITGFTTRYSDVIVSNGFSVPLCYDISSSNANGTLSNTDTRIYAQTSATAWQSVNDDHDGYVTSYTRVWMLPGQTFTLRFSDYSSGYNSIDFNQVVQRNPATTLTDCGSQTGYSFIKGVSTSSYPEFVRAN